MEVQIIAEKRIRDTVLAIRLTQKEKDKIKDKAAKAGLSTNEFIIKCTNRAKLKAPLDLKPVVIELKRIGTNLNQIALKVNSGTVTVVNLGETKNELAELYSKLNDIADGNS